MINEDTKKLFKMAVAADCVRLMEVATGDCDPIKHSKIVCSMFVQAFVALLAMVPDEKRDQCFCEEVTAFVKDIKQTADRVNIKLGVMVLGEQDEICN